MSQKQADGITHGDKRTLLSRQCSAERLQRFSLIFPYEYSIFRTMDTSLNHSKITEPARSSRIGARRRTARESFGLASECIGKCEAGMSLFAITRGQWSMIDAVLHVLDQVGPATLSIWTWTVAEYEVEVLTRLRDDSRLTSGKLIIDAGARTKNAAIIRGWQDAFGPDSVRYVVNHAKLATIESESGMRFLLRGSMNLNFNPRFEQFDITEGGEDFDLVRSIEDELPILADSSSNAEAYAATKLNQAFDSQTLSMFSGLKVWAK